MPPWHDATRNLLKSCSRTRRSLRWRHERRTEQHACPLHPVHSIRSAGPGALRGVQAASAGPLGCAAIGRQQSRDSEALLRLRHQRGPPVEFVQGAWIDRGRQAAANARSFCAGYEIHRFRKVQTSFCVPCLHHCICVTRSGGSNPARSACAAHPAASCMPEIVILKRVYIPPLGDAATGP